MIAAVQSCSMVPCFYYYFALWRAFLLETRARIAGGASLARHQTALRVAIITTRMFLFQADAMLRRERSLRKEALALRDAAQREHDTLKQYNEQV
jgi:hypothetical protein